MTTEQIKNYIKKEIFFQNLQNEQRRAEVAIEILLTTGLVEIYTLITLRDLIRNKAKEIIKKEKLNV